MNGSWWSCSGRMSRVRSKISELGLGKNFAKTKIEIVVGDEV